MINLESLANALQEQGYDAQVHFVSEPDLPYVSIRFDTEDEERGRILHLTPSLADDDAPAHSQFIWFELGLPFQAGESQQTALMYALAIVNDELELGKFNLDAEQRLVYCYTLAIPALQPVDLDLLFELLLLIEFEQEHFSAYLAGVCKGEISHSTLRDLIHESEDYE